MLLKLLCFVYTQITESETGGICLSGSGLTLLGQAGCVGSKIIIISDSGFIQFSSLKFFQLPSV